MTSVAQTPITQQFIQIHTPQVINQVAAAILQSDGDQKVTIRLDPPELGKVDIDMKFTDRGITVAVSAERSESVELMRRNANELLRELRESGLSLSLSDMSFGQQKQGQNNSSQSESEKVFFSHSEQSSYTTQKSQMQPTAMAANVNVSMSDRLDLRL
jgi:flagellar hook-length control protein FliK